MKKKILFVINTLGNAGAENALMELLRNIPQEEYEVSVLVVLGQGEMVRELPEYVRLLNKKYDSSPVLDRQGRKRMYQNIFFQLFRNGAVFRRFGYLCRQLVTMVASGRLQPDKLLWRCMADGAQRVTEHFDLAVAYLEGGAAYYVADYVSADKKVAFIHIDYEMAGYTRQMDQDCYLKYDKIFTVSQEVRQPFVTAYPEMTDKTEVFHNMVNAERIKEKSAMPGGFADDFKGFRILTVSRLTAQKALEVSIEAMSLLKKKVSDVRWYVLGDGDQRAFLEKQITRFGVEKDFVLLGAVDNPFPYYKQADLYVHASKYEGKSIAIQEACILGKAVIVTDCSGNREQVTDGVDGELCDFRADSICEHILRLMQDEEKRIAYGKAAGEKTFFNKKDVEKLFNVMRDE